MRIENALQAALRSAHLAPQVVAKSPAKKKKPVAQPKVYRYRGLPCSIAPHNERWYVEGVDANGGCGVLEWCLDKADAEKVLAEMKRYPQFSKLAACPSVPGAGMNRLVAAALS